MEKLLAVLKKVLHPSKLVLLIVPTVVFSALILIFLTERLNSAAAYPIFVLSAYCLTILLLPLPKLIRNAKTGIRYASMWFISMAVYYLALGLIRLSLILSRRCHASEALW